MSLINASEAASVVSATIPNAATFSVQQTAIVTTNVPVQSTALAVPTDHAVSIQNSPTNGANVLIFVANSSANALTPATRIQLSRSQSISLNVDNLSDIWINSATVGATATLLVEA